MHTLFSSIKGTWGTNIRADILSGLTVALALIPEVIGFSLVAGVSPMVGLYTSVFFMLIIAFAGGRPGMISAAAGATALLMVALVKNHGLDYLFATTIVTGILQIIFGFFRIDRFLTFIPHTVMIGFVNALAILIFLVQLPYFIGAGPIMYAMVVGSLVIIYLLPRLTKVIPAPLIAIVLMTGLSMFLRLDLQTIGDMGPITRELPMFRLPSIPWTLESLSIIFPYALALSLVGLLESLLTATIVDEMTETRSNKNREVKGQGIANFIIGFFGGMAGCAMIGQSVINIKSGGRTRLSALAASISLILLLLVFADIVKQIPMAVLVAVMITVSISTFEWRSLTTLHKIARVDALVMVATVVVVMITHDLSKGVLVGVVLSALFFGWKIARLHASSTVDGERKTYTISGQLFFGTTTHFADVFDVINDPAQVVIDLRHSHVWDHSAVIVLEKVAKKYQRLNKQVTIIGLNDESLLLLKKTGVNFPLENVPVTLRAN